MELLFHFYPSITLIPRSSIKSSVHHFASFHLQIFSISRSRDVFVYGSGLYLLYFFSFFHLKSFCSFPNLRKWESAFRSTLVRPVFKSEMPVGNSTASNMAFRCVSLSLFPRSIIFLVYFVHGSLDLLSLGVLLFFFMWNDFNLIREFFVSLMGKCQVTTPWEVVMTPSTLSSAKPEPANTFLVLCLSISNQLSSMKWEPEPTVNSSTLSNSSAAKKMLPTISPVATTQVINLWITYDFASLYASIYIIIIVLNLLITDSCILLRPKFGFIFINPLQLARKSWICAWIGLESLPTTAQGFKVFSCSMLWVVVLDLVWDLCCLRGFPLIMERNPSLGSPSTHPHRSLQLLWSHTTLCSLHILFWSTLMLLFSLITRLSMTSAASLWILSALLTPTWIASSLRFDGNPIMLFQFGTFNIHD